MCILKSYPSSKSKYPLQIWWSKNLFINNSLRLGETQGHIPQYNHILQMEIKFISYMYVLCMHTDHAVLAQALSCSVYRITLGLATEYHLSIVEIL